MKKVRPVHVLRQDIRYGWRSSVKRPFETAAMVAILTLGLGGVTGIWSTVDFLWLRPLPYPQPDRLVLLWETHRQVPGDWRVASLVTALAWRDELHELEALAWSHPWRPVLDNGELKSLPGARVSSGFFKVLGVAPSLGRDFTPEDDQPGAPPVVILSHGLWLRELGGDPEVLGRLLPLEGDGTSLAAQVIGILPREAAVVPPLTFEPAEIWMPLAVDGGMADPGGRYFRVIGRLAAGGDLRRLGEAAAAAGRRVAERYPGTYDGWSTATQSVREDILAPRRPALAAFLVAVSLAFVVAVSNVSLLLLARVIARRRETAVRQALGARAVDLCRQGFLESLLLVGISAAAGLALAWGLVRSALALGLSSWLGGRTWSMDGRTLLLAAAAAAVTSAVFTVLPAARASRRSLFGDLRDGLHARPAFGGGFVVVQVAVSFVLLVTAALLSQSFDRLTRVDPGFDSRGVLTVQLRVPRSIHPDAIAVDATWRLLLERIEALPQVRSAALATHLPMRGRSMSTTAAPDPEREVEPVRLEIQGVSRSYFRSLGIPLLAGRDFSSNGSSEPGRHELRGVLMSEAAARVLWPGEAPVGKRLLLDWGSSGDYEVIGVVGDVRHDGLNSAVRPAVYLPFFQFPRRSMTLVVRSSTDLESVRSELRARIRGVDGGLVIEEVRPMARIVENTVAARRGYTLIILVFATGSLLLAAAGTYGTVACAVSQRRSELGVRLAVGASPAGLVRMVVGEGLRYALTGIVLGLAGALLAPGFLSRLLYGVSASDPKTFAGTSALMLAVVLVASYIPARRAAQADPATTLRGK